jgi:hypothetical protein
MGKFLRDVVLSCSEGSHPQNSKPIFAFGIQTNFLERLYLDSLPKTRTDGIAKVIIEACKSLPIEPPQSPRAGQQKKLENMIDVLRLHKIFDFEAYFAADKETRKRLALDCLQEGLLEVAAIRGWDNAPLQQAYKTILAGEVVSWRPWGRALRSPDGKLKAEVWCKYDSDKAEIFILVLRRGKLVSKEMVTTVKSGDVWIRQAARVRWASDEKVEWFPFTDKEMFGH